MNGTTQNALKSGMTDLRQIRSRDLLRAALLSLLEKKTLEEISPRDIASTARVGYATFYRHFPTKEALLVDLARDEVDRMMRLAQPLTDAANTSAACYALCAYVDEHRTLWTMLLTGSAESLVRKEFLRAAREIAPTFSRPANAVPPELGVVLAVGSVVEFLAWWLAQRNPMSVKRAASILDRIVIAPTVGKARKKSTVRKAAAKRTTGATGRSGS
jgi:AcrR family transcriptional regulator